MAKAKKEVVPELHGEITDTATQVVQSINYAESVDIPKEQEKVASEFMTKVISRISNESEIEFLENLLHVQNVGSWHGPAAGLIKERLKVLKG